MPLVVGLTGNERAGKTTIAKAVVKLLPNAVMISMAESLKRQVCLNNDITMNQLIEDKEKYRQEMIRVGEKMRETGEIISAMKQKLAETTADVVIIDDIRYTGEADLCEILYWKHRPGECEDRRYELDEIKGAIDVADDWQNIIAGQIKKMLRRKRKSESTRKVESNDGCTQFSDGEK